MTAPQSTNHKSRIANEKSKIGHEPLLILTVGTGTAGARFGLRWQAERDTALDGEGSAVAAPFACGLAESQSAVAAALCRRTP